MRDRQHFVEWATFIDKLPPNRIEHRTQELIQLDYSIHFHSFILQSFLPIISYLQQEIHAPVMLKACADTLQGSNEFLVVLTRT